MAAATGMTDQEPGHDSEHYNPERDAKPIGDLLIESGTPAGRIFAQVRSWSRSSPALLLLAVLIFGGYEYFLSSRHNSDDYANLNGTLLTNQGKYDEAIAQFDRSIKVAPGTSPIWAAATAIG
jgi:hypothetical protein